jgi:membrane protease YdiL (CAAX protease family)
MNWPIVLGLGIVWAAVIWDGFSSMQVEEVGVNKEVSLRYFDRTLRLLEAADRAVAYAQWSIGTNEKEIVLKSILETITKNHAYVDALEGEQEDLAVLLSYKLGLRESLIQTFEDTEFRAGYRDWLLAGHGAAWQYELFIEATKDPQVSEIYSDKNDRLLRRVMAMGILYDLMIVAGILIAIYLLFRKRRFAAVPHRLPERWSACSVLGAFFAINLLLTPLLEVLGHGYLLLLYLVPATLAYTFYDFIWRSFDTVLLVFLFLKTPRNAWRVLRFRSPVHVPLLLAAFAVISLIEYGMYSLMPIGETDPTDFLSEADPDIGSMSFMLFSSVILAPVFEEIVFRGFLLQGLRKKLGNMNSVLISTLLFTLVHVQYDIWGCLSVAFMGFAAAFLTLRTGSLNTAIAFHALINLWVTANVYFQYQAPL